MQKRLTRMLKGIFNAFGLEITRRNLWRSTWEGFFEHVLTLGFKPCTVIDVGVADGTFELYEAFPEATFLLVEPVQEFEEALKAITRKYKAEYVIAAATDKPGMVIPTLRMGCVQIADLYRQIHALIKQSWYYL